MGDCIQNAMLFVTASLLVLLLAAVVVAVETFKSAEPDPAWGDGTDLRERLTQPLPANPLRRGNNASRQEMLAHLRLLRGEYRMAWTLCRFLAPISREDGYAGKLTLELARFNLLYAGVWTATALGAAAKTAIWVDELGRMGESVRSASNAMLAGGELGFGTGAA